MLNLCFFASGGFYGPRSAFRSVQGVKHRRTIFHARWDRYGFHKKRVKTHYVELAFFASGGLSGSHRTF
jgi:hypothetical protein